MSSRAASSSQRPLRRVLVLADESASWKIAGLRQLDRLALSLHEFAEARQASDRVSVCVFWSNGSRLPLPDVSHLKNIELTDRAEEFLRDQSEIDLVVSTRLFLHRDSLEQLLASLPVPCDVHANGTGLWQIHALKFQTALSSSHNGQGSSLPW